MAVYKLIKMAAQGAATTQHPHDVARANIRKANQEAAIQRVSDNSASYPSLTPGYTLDRVLLGGSPTGKYRDPITGAGVQAGWDARQIRAAYFDRLRKYKSKALSRQVSPVHFAVMNAAQLPAQADLAPQDAFSGVVDINTRQSLYNRGQGTMPQFTPRQIQQLKQVYGWDKDMSAQQVHEKYKREIAPYVAHNGNNNKPQPSAYGRGITNYGNNTMPS